MKKIAIFSVLFASFAVIADAAPAPTQRRGAPVAATASTGGAPAAAAPTTAARAGVRSQAQGGGTPAVAARSGTTPVAAAPAAPGVSTARSATVSPKTSVIQSGTNVAAATTNTVVSEECRIKYFGCMDSFCMIDNDNGARCQCSDKKADLDKILADLEKLDRQSRDMATTGVEKIQMGQNANEIIAQARAVAAQSMVEEKKTAAQRRTIDMSIFDAPAFFGSDADEIESVDLLKGKSGDALHSAARDLCLSQMKECSQDLRMLQTMYASTIQGDCRAFENALKVRKSDSEKRLAAAEQALRAAALESFEAQNKFEFGPCISAFKQCMINEGGCKADFTGCVGLFQTGTVGSARTQTKDIMGSATRITINSSTYDTILAKRPICEHITNQCVKYKGQVWDAFLKDIAPTLKSAELIADSNRRQNCIGTISDCFQKGCRDSIGPEGTDESFDLCLTRPLAMVNICKVQLDECGIPTNPPQMAENHEIWGFVVAKLASLRVDSCTRAIKQCLQSEDRCGEDYTKCVGLDVSGVMAMCPPDKMMVSCAGKDSSGAAITARNVQEKIEEIIFGVLLNIDNNFLTACQVAADEALERVCGDDLCESIFAKKPNFGTGSLNISDINAQRQIKVTGLLDFSMLSFGDEDEGTSANINKITRTDMAGVSAPASNAELSRIQREIEAIFAQLENDQTVKNCIHGRDTTRATRGAQGRQNEARFPNLIADSKLAIFRVAIDQARANYYAKLEQLQAEVTEKIQEVSQRELSMGVCYDPATMGPLGGGATTGQ